MIEKIEDVPAGIDALRAVGKITKEDYDAVVIPLIDGAAREGRLLRCLCEVGPDFRGLTPSAAWEDLKIGLRALHMIEACAVVSDTGWVRESSIVAAFFMPCPVRVFGLQERDQAIAWLSSLPERAATSARPGPPIGDWLVVPGPAGDRMWRWGRIVDVVPGDGPLHYLVRWFGDTHDTVVSVPSDARIESAAAWPHPGSGAFGLWPAV